MTRIGKIISTAIAGNIKKPGTPNPSIQPIDPSKLKILLKAEIKNNAEIKILPTKSKTFAIRKIRSNEGQCQKIDSLIQVFFKNLNIKGTINNIISKRMI